MCLSWEDIARQSCAMVPRWRFFCDFLRPAFPASRVQHVSDLHLKFTLRPHHVWKYGRQSTATAEIRQGKKEERRRNHREKYNWTIKITLLSMSFQDCMPSCIISHNQSILWANYCVHCHTHAGYINHVITCVDIPPATRMWANAQRDGHPAEYRWRPLFNAAKFVWRPILKCRAVTLPRRETRWNL